MSERLLFTVGNPMMGDDAAGPLLAAMLTKTPVEGWQVINGGSAPENYLDQIRSLAPATVLIVDSADMCINPGEIRRISADQITLPFLITTHTLPLSFLIEALAEFVPTVTLIGIQSGIVAFGYPISQEVCQTVDFIYHQLSQADFPENLINFENEANPSLKESC